MGLRPIEGPLPFFAFLTPQFRWILPVSSRENASLCLTELAY